MYVSTSASVSTETGPSTVEQGVQASVSVRTQSVHACANVIGKGVQTDF